MGASVSELPPNYALLNLSESSNKLETLDDAGICKTHSDRLGLWCSECMIAMCGMCYFQDQSHKEHEVILVITAIKKHKLKYLSDKISKAVLLSKVFSCLELMLSPVDNVINLASAAHVILKDAEQSPSIQSLLAHVKQVEDIIKQFPFPPLNALSETENEIIPLGGEGHLNLEDVVSSHSSQDTLHERTVSNDAIQNEATGGQKILCTDMAIPSLKCSAVLCTNTDIRRAKLTWEDGGIHLYALSDTLKKGDITVEMSLMQELIPHSKPKVFLDLAVRGRRLGRVLICLWGHLERSQHFLSLCLGTLGPSYQGTTFTSIQFKGKPGESLLGGSSLTDSETSSPAIREDLEWNDDYTGDMKEGVIAGWPSVMGFQGSSFVICVSDNPDMQLLCPFGEVESGLDVVQEAIQHDPVTDVTIQEVGAVISKLKK